MRAIAPAGSHVVQFYERGQWLHRALARFFEDAWRTGSPALMISRRSTFDAVRAVARKPGPIEFVDAEAAVSGFMNGGTLDRARAAATVHEAFARVGADRDDVTAWIFGEMVNILCSRGLHDAAIELERLWNEAEDPRLTVLCGYDLAHFGHDPHDHRYRTICRAHAHVVPATPLAVPIVYVVDDDESMRRSLARLIGSIDVPVQTFASAEAFRDEVDPSAPGCLLLDIQLPGMSGTDLQTLMAAEGWRLPIVTMSGLHDDRMEATALRLGAIKFLHKPFDADALFDALADAEA